MVELVNYFLHICSIRSSFSNSFEVAGGRAGQRAGGQAVRRASGSAGEQADGLENLAVLVSSYHFKNNFVVEHGRTRSATFAYALGHA